MRVHWTFAVPMVLPFLFEWQRQPLNALIHTAIFASVFFSAVLVHELAHMQAARSRGVETDRIELYLFGGWTYFKQPVQQPTSWLWITFAGPLVNLVMGMLFLAGYLALNNFSDRFLFPANLLAPPRSNMMEWTLWLGSLLNLALGVLNLLPAFPLDGGIIARELLQPHLGPRRATKVVGLCGLAISALRFPIMLIVAASGLFLWLPPPFRPNWRAVRGVTHPRKGRAPAARKSESEEIEWRGRGGWRIHK